MTRPLPFVWPYALVFWVVYVWAFFPEFGIVRRARFGATPVPREDRGSTGVIVVGGSLVILLVFVLAGAARWAALPGAPQVWFMAGLALLVGGSLLRRHCFRVLGKFFTGAVTIQDDHRVVDSGAYRWVRHPSYTAALVMIAGIALALGNGLSIAVALVGGFAIYTYRARVEEQALLAALGAPYAEFMATRKRFIPFVV